MTFDNANRKYLGDHPDWLDSANSLIAQLSDKRLGVVSPAGNPITPKVVWEIQNYEQLAIHRVIDLCDGVIQSWEAGRPVISFILTRAICENAAAIYDIADRIKSLVESKQFLDIHNTIVNRLLGGRVKEADLKVPNILGAIDKAMAYQPGFRTMYDDLSEFAHPNYSGMLGLYGHIDKERIELRVDRTKGISEVKFGMLIYPLIASLRIVILAISSLHESYPAVWKLSDEDQAR
jgi:hypothetical protein